MHSTQRFHEKIICTGTQKTRFLKQGVRRRCNPPSFLLMYHSTTHRPQPHRYISLGNPDNLAQRRDSACERGLVSSVGFAGVGSIGVLRRKGESRGEQIANIERQFSPYCVEYKYSDIDNTEKLVRISVLEILPPSYLVKSFNPSQRLEYLRDLAIRARFARSLAASLDESKPRRLAKGLTRRGVKLINDSVSLLAYKYGQKSLGFYTLTCPYSDVDDIQAFNDNLPEIARRYFQQIKRIYAQQNATFSYIGVYEIQPGRLARTGNECLHIHYVAPALDSSGRFRVLHSTLLYWYARIVKDVCGEELPFPPRVDAQLVRANAAAYLAKYFCKSASPSADGNRPCSVARLSSWYSISRNLLQACRRSRVELPGYIADAIFRASAASRYHEWCAFIAPVLREVDGVERHVGCVFELRENVLTTLRALKFPEVSHLI